jgi:hypothetical protein
MTSYRNHFVRLDEEDFRILIRGGEVNKTTHGTGTVHLILADIGFPLMVRELKRAIEDANGDMAWTEEL